MFLITRQQLYTALYSSSLLIRLFFTYVSIAHGRPRSNSRVYIGVISIMQDNCMRKSSPTRQIHTSPQFEHQKFSGTKDSWGWAVVQISWLFYSFTGFQSLHVPFQTTIGHCWCPGRCAAHVFLIGANSVISGRVIAFFCIFCGFPGVFEISSDIIRCEMQSPAITFFSFTLVYLYEIHSVILAYCISHDLYEFLKSPFQ